MDSNSDTPPDPSTGRSHGLAIITPGNEGPRHVNGTPSRPTTTSPHTRSRLASAYGAPMPEDDRHGGDLTVTDVRFPERWMYDRRLRRLSGDAFRLFMMSLAWSVSQRTDGVIDDMDLPDVPYVDATLIGDLEKHGLWRRGDSQWIITDFAATQTLRRELERLESIRRADRERKARQRSQPTTDDADIPPEAPEDVRVDAPRTGKAKAKLGEEDLPAPANGNLGARTPVRVESSYRSKPMPIVATCTRCEKDTAFSLIDGLCRKCWGDAR